MSLNARTKDSTYIKETIETLLKVSRENKSAVWRDIAKRLSGGDRRYASINLGKINKIANEGDVIVIPGSVLGSGVFRKKVTLAGLRASKSAMDKIQASGSRFVTLKEYASSGEKAENVKIIR
ncbi:MAG: 50S ribosomal protein L18e [Candidatus Thermoplasmatota archaeon]|nr:50S ribosomal protein L18e [Candidatus Thermoplasmatota archaeon]